MTTQGPLGGLRVVETGAELGAWCGKLLADAGAEVVKVEPPEGERLRCYRPFYRDAPDINRSLFFWHYNTSKRSVTIDLKASQGRELFHRLGRWADVVIDSNPPRFLDRLGLGYAALSEDNTGLVMCAISPLGQEGPHHDLAMTDLTAMAYGGVAWSCGYDDHTIPPVRPGGNNGYQTACHFAVTAIMAALLHRDVTGAGQRIDTNMHAALNVTTETATYNWLTAGETVQRQTGRPASTRSSAPMMTLCADGRYVNSAVPARSVEQWYGLLAWLDEEGVAGDLLTYPEPPSSQAAVAGDPVSREQFAKLAAAISDLCAKHDAYTIFRGAQDRGFQWGIVYSPEEALSDPHFKARGFPVEVDHPELGQSFIYPGAPYRFTSTPWRVRRRAPLLGEDNEEIFCRVLGLSEAEIDELRAGGVITRA